MQCGGSGNLARSQSRSENGIEYRAAIFTFNPVF